MWLALTLLACSNDAGDSADTGSSVPEPNKGIGEMAFVDATDAWGLANVNGVDVRAVDLDGDGYPDLVVVDGAGIDQPSMDAPTDPRYHWVLMNRSDGAGGRVFVDATEDSGLFQRRSGDGLRPVGAMSFGDLDGDGDVDAFTGVFNDPHSDPAGHWTDLSDVLLNDGSGRFSLAPLSDDLQKDFPMIGASLVDADGDGNLDLYLGEWFLNSDIYNNNSWLNWLYGANDRLLRGNGNGTFTDVTEAAGMILDESVSYGAQHKVLDGKHARPSMGVSACDVDGDGWPDLLEQAYGRQWNLLWHNNGDGTFEEVGRDWGYAGDANTNYFDDWTYDCYCVLGGDCSAVEPDPDFPYNVSQCQNLVAQGFVWSPGWSDEEANLNGNTFSAACGDLDNDGDVDLVLAQVYHDWAGKSSDPTGVEINDGTGRFEWLDSVAAGLEREPEVVHGSWNFGDQKAAIADLDNDGMQDIIVPSGSAYPGNVFNLWRQWDTLQFYQAEDRLDIDVTMAPASTVADFDRDGDLDMVTTSLDTFVGDDNTKHRVYFFENQSTGGYHWLRVRVEQTSGTNSNGVGARVAVRAGGFTRIRDVTSGYGQGSHNELVLTFGLGLATKIRDVTVTWVGGAQERFEGIQVDQQVVLTQGGGVAVENP